MHFRTPFRLVVSGPTSCGKTEFVKKLITNQDYLITGVPIKSILWCCKDKNFVPSGLKKLSSLKIHKGIPAVSQLQPHTLVVLDDLMTSLDKDISDIFTIHSHHKNVSILLILQNFYHQGRHLRDISLQASHIVFFKTVRDKTQFSTLARQLSPSNWKQLEKLYIDVTRKPFSYIIIDLTQQTNDLFRIKTDIFNKNFFKIFAPYDEVQANCTAFAPPLQEQVFIASALSG